MSNKLQLRRDTAANWEAANPVLAQGEIGLILDSNGKTIGQKIGDGVTEWNKLEVDKKVEYTKEFSRNLINPSEVQVNTYISYTATGLVAGYVQPTAYNGAACSGYIPVTPGKTYYLTRGSSSTASAAFCFLKSDYTPTGVAPAIDPNTDEVLPWSFSDYINASRAYKAPADAAYAIICLAFSGWVDTATQIVGFQFEEGEEATPYIPYGFRDVISEEHLPLKITELPEQVADLQEEVADLQDEKIKPNKFVYNGERDAISYIEGSFGDTIARNNFKILRSIEQSGGQSECFNFESFVVNNTKVHDSSDDICPIYFADGGGYIGANHGCDAFYKCTADSHGKTFADIGSKYKDSTATFVIMDIVDENNLILLGSLSISGTYPLWGKIFEPSISSYTWVSGGSNTDSFSVSKVVMVQGKPLEKLEDTKIYVDGKEVTLSGTYQFGKSVIISQNYLIANPHSVYRKVSELEGTFTEHPNYAEIPGIEFCVKLNISYVFTDVSHNFVAQTLTYLQDSQKLGYFGFMQTGAISGSNTKLYIPKALPVSDFDFRLNPSYGASDVTETRNITTTYWENPLLPPDRFIYNSNLAVFNGGFLFDYGVGGNNRKYNTTNAFYLYTTRKIYIQGIGGMDGDNKTQSTGNNYSTISFRIYKPASSVGDGVFMENCFEYDNKFYLYLDFNATGVYTIDIPAAYIGKSVDVFEKSDNVELLTPITSNSITINVKTCEPMYGYLVAKIESVQASSVPTGGTTEERPKGNKIQVGFQYFDTTIGKPIYASATSVIPPYDVTWVDANGDEVL